MSKIVKKKYYEIHDDYYSFQSQAVKGKTLVFPLGQDISDTVCDLLRADQDITGVKAIYCYKNSSENLLRILEATNFGGNQISVNMLYTSSVSSVMQLMQYPTLTSFDAARIYPTSGFVLDSSLYSSIMNSLQTNIKLTTCKFYYVDQAKIGTCYYLDDHKKLGQFADMLQHNTTLIEFYVAGLRENYTYPDRLVNAFKQNHSLEYCTLGNGELEKQVQPHFTSNQVKGIVKSFIPLTSSIIVASYLYAHEKYLTDVSVANNSFSFSSSSSSGLAFDDMSGSDTALLGGLEDN